jgi:chorismate-pyruvate lyase
MTTMRFELSRSERARAALVDLGSGFLDAATVLTGCHPVEPDAMPDPFERLLVHHDHMTTRLGEFHGRPVSLEILKQEMRGEAYSRLIALRPHGRDHVVEVGFVRIDLACTSQPVRDMIVEGLTPLGDILIGHNVLRRIEPQWFFRFDAKSPLVAHFARPIDAAFGRLGVIHCDHRPAIRLLEIVSGG